MTEYKTRTISHTLEELIKMIDSEKFTEELSKRIQGIYYEADMIKHNQYDDEAPHGWEVCKLHGDSVMTEGTISCRQTAALALGRAILDTMETVFIEPRFLDGYGE